MCKTPDILNFFTELKATNGVSFTGQFVKPESNIWFIGRTELNAFRKIQDLFTICLSGEVNGNNIRIQSAIIAKSSTTGFEPQYVDVHILPFEIVAGKDLDDNTKAERIEGDFPELNWFFGRLLEPEHPKTNEIKSFAAIIPFDFPPICYDDGNKRLSFLRGVSIEDTWSGMTLKNMNKAIIEFKTATDVDEAIRELARLRLFLAFLADDFVAYPPIFSFTAPNSDCLKGTDYKLADKIIWLNDNIARYPVKRERPFRIPFYTIKSVFCDAWARWCAFHGEKSNQPMIELFFEIISNKSIGLNRFLNICQALEVYSTHHRNTECKTRLTAERASGSTSDNHVTLRIRLADLLTLHNDIFARIEAEIAALSQNIADIRNYYTHYNPKKQEELEKKYGDISQLHSQFDGLLYYLLLATVYKEIAIPSDVIKQNLTDGNARFGASPERTFEGPDKDTTPF